MIFVTVGTHSDGFERLVKAADRYAATTERRVLIQRGASRYCPEHAESFDFAPGNEIEALSRSAEIIVTHAGAGSLLTSLAASANVVVVPRQRRHGEHMDDHQIELATALHQAGRVRMVLDLEELPLVLSGPPARLPAGPESDDVPLLPYLQYRLADIAGARGRR